MNNKEKMDEDLPKTLAELRARGDGMNLPEQYFEQMEGAVFARLEASGSIKQPRLLRSKSPKWRILFARPKAVLAYAAALSLVVAAVWFVRQNDSPTPVNLSVEHTLTEDDIENYLLDNLHEFEIAHLAALGNDLDVEAPSTNKEKTPSPGPSSDEIHSEDLDKILDDMTEEELEKIL